MDMFLKSHLKVVRKFVTPFWSKKVENADLDKPLDKYR